MKEYLEKLNKKSRTNSFTIYTGIKGMKYWKEVEKQIDELNKRNLGLIK